MGDGRPSDIGDGVAVLLGEVSWVPRQVAVLDEGHRLLQVGTLKLVLPERGLDIDPLLVGGGHFQGLATSHGRYQEAAPVAALHFVPVEGHDSHPSLTAIERS